MSRFNGDPYEAAAAEDLVVVLPHDDELLLDIDTTRDLIHYQEMRDLLGDNGFPTEEVRRTRSKSGNWHVYVRVLWTERLGTLERVMLQAMLGSDRKRELLSYIRIKKGEPRPPTVLFEVKQPVQAAA